MFFLKKINLKTRVQETAIQIIINGFPKTQNKNKEISPKLYLNGRGRGVPSWRGQQQAYAKCLVLTHSLYIIRDNVRKAHTIFSEGKGIHLSRKGPNSHTRRWRAGSCWSSNLGRQCWRYILTLGGCFL